MNNEQCFSSYANVVLSVQKSLWEFCYNPVLQLFKSVGCKSNCIRSCSLSADCVFCSALIFCKISLLIQSVKLLVYVFHAFAIFSPRIYKFEFRSVLRACVISLIVFGTVLLHYAFIGLHTSLAFFSSYFVELLIAVSCVFSSCC